MNLTEQRELQRIVEALSKPEFRDTQEDFKLIHHPDFQKLKAMAYEPRVNKTEPNAITALKWEDLLSMKASIETGNFDNETREELYYATRKEIERRLLNLLPKEGGDSNGG